MDTHYLSREGLKMSFFGVWINLGNMCSTVQYS